MGLQSVLVATVNGAFLFVDLIFVAANAIKLIEGGWFPLLLAGVVAFLMLTWRTGYLLLEQQRSRLRRREDEFVAWVLDSRLGGSRNLYHGKLGHPARPDASPAAQPRLA